MLTASSSHLPPQDVRRDGAERLCVLRGLDAFERARGRLGVGGGARARAFERAGPLGLAQEKLARELAVAALAHHGLHGAAQARLLFEQVDERQRDLAFQEVNARGLAERALVGGEVEQVVNKLEGDAEAHAVVAKRRLPRVVSAAEDRADLAAGAEEVGGLALEDVEVLLLGNVRAPDERERSEERR